MRFENTRIWASFPPAKQQGPLTQYICFPGLAGPYLLKLKQISGPAPLAFEIKLQSSETEMMERWLPKILVEAVSTSSARLG